MSCSLFTIGMTECPSGAAFILDVDELEEGTASSAMELLRELRLGSLCSTMLRYSTGIPERSLI